MKKKSQKCYCNQDNVQLVTDPSIQEIPGTSKDIYGHPDVSDKSRRGKVRSQDDLVDSLKANKQISDSQFENVVYEEKNDFVPKVSYNETIIGKVRSQDYVGSSKANKQIPDSQIKNVVYEQKSVYVPKEISIGKVRSQDYVDSSKANKQISDPQFKNALYEEKSDFVPQTSYNETIGKVPSQDYVDSSKVNKQISDSAMKKVYSEEKRRGVCTCGRVLALDYKPSYNVQYKNNTFFIEIDVNEFTPVGLRVSMTKDLIQIEGVVLQRHDTVDQVCAEFTKTYTIPFEMDPSTISAQLYSNGILLIKADKKKNSSISSDKGIISTSLPLEKQSSSHVKVEVGKDVECGNCNELRKVPPDSQIIPITEIKENYKGFGNKPQDCRCAKINDCIKFV